MPLNKQTISVPFAQGLETKTDDLQEQLEGFEVLENVIFDTPNQIRKRRGYSLLNTRTPDEVQIQNARYLTQYEDELGLFNNENYFTYSESIDRWLNKGRVFTAFPTSENIIRNFRNKENLDMTVIENIAFFTYQDNSGIRLSAKDNNNCNFLISDVLISPDGINPRIANIQNLIVVFYVVDREIRYRTVNITNPQNISNEFIFSQALGSINRDIDVQNVNDSIAVAFNSAALARTLNLQSNLTVQSQGIGSLRDSGIVTFQVNPPADNNLDEVIIEGTGDINNTLISITPNTGLNNPINGLSQAILNIENPITLTNIQNPLIPETTPIVRNGTNFSVNVNDPVINNEEEVIVEFSGDVNNVQIDITPNLRTNNNPRAATAGVTLATGPLDIFSGGFPSGTFSIGVEDNKNPESRNGSSINIIINRSETENNTAVFSGSEDTTTTFTLNINSNDFPVITAGEFKQLFSGQDLIGEFPNILTVIDPNNLANNQTINGISLVIPTTIIPINITDDDTILINRNFTTISFTSILGFDFRQFRSGVNNDLDITSAELAELITTGDVQNKQIKLIDLDNLRLLQSASGGGNDILVSNANGDNITSTFDGSIQTPVNITSQQFSEFLRTGSTSINVNLIDPLGLIQDLTASGGDDEILQSGQNFDGESIVLNGGGAALQVLNDIDQFTSSIIFPTETAVLGLNIFIDENENIVTSYSDGLQIRQFTTDKTGRSILQTPQLLVNAPNASHITIVDDNQGTALYYDVIDFQNPKNSLINLVRLDENRQVLSESILARSVSLASRAFTVNGTSYVNTVHDSGLQATYFIMDSDANIVSKIAPGLAGNTITSTSLPKTFNLPDDKVILTTQIKGRTITDDNQFFSVLGVAQNIVDFNPERPYQNTEIGDILHIAGGFLMQYDGNRVVEHGFHIFPEDLIANPVEAPEAPVLQPGEYQYSAIYVWTDNRGNLHRSAPAIGLPVTVTNEPDTQNQQVTIPTLRLTQKDDVVIELYRTEANGTLFYKVSETAIPTENDTTVDTVTIEDTITDEDLISREILYTTGGVLDNIAAPSASIITDFADRLVLAGLEDEHRIMYSKQRFDDEPVEFSDILTIQLNSNGGPITALHAMDEKLIIFKEQSIFYLSGDGPNNLGLQDSFIKPELISSDIGCINIDSVVITPEGLMFMSSKGIYLLSRNLQVTYIGAEVERFNNLTVTSAITVPEENQVRFTTIDGETLVYNYFFRKWAAFSNHRAINAVNVNFTYYYLRFDGTLYEEDENSFTDSGSYVNIVLESGWISFAGVQAFQRVYKLLLLGVYRSPHRLRVRVAYDFNEAFTQEVIIDTSDFIDNNRYGDNSPYGSPETTPYGGGENVHQMRIDLARQKCQSIKIRIEELETPNTNLGEGLSLSNILFEVGSKVGPNKISTGKQYGTK